MTESIFHPKPVDELTFTDDGMFQAVLRDPDICAELVERLLHIRVNHVEYPELEKTIAPYYTTKGVRLDVYIKDTDKIIDVELQSYPQEALGKRTRYYQSMIDMDSLMKGQDYSELKDSYILFICKHDPFKDESNKHYGLPCYTFKNTCEENPLVNLNDKSLKVIYNASAYNEEKDEKVKALRMDKKAEILLDNKYMDNKNMEIDFSIPEDLPEYFEDKDKYLEIFLDNESIMTVPLKPGQQ